MNFGFVKVGTAVTDIAVADCKRNTQRIIEAVNQAVGRGVKVLAFPELCVTGYSCADLFFHSTLLDAAERSVCELADASCGKDILFSVGFPLKRVGKLYNCSAVIFNGEILGIVPQACITGTYKRRYFFPAPENNSKINFGGREIAFGSKLIFSCENIADLAVAIENDSYTRDSAESGATVILCPDAAGETIGKAEYRRALVSVRSAELSCAYVYVSAGEGESTQDMVFSGHSIIGENGSLLAESRLFENTMLTADIDIERLVFDRTANNSCVSASGEQDIISFSFASIDNKLERKIDKYPFVPECSERRATVCEQTIMMQALGLKKRIEHTGAKSAVIGVSGGLDSTLAIIVAAKAFDMCNRSRKDIIAVTMPCFGTTARTKSNAEKLCETLGVSLKTVDISEAVRVHFRDIGQAEDNYDVTYENAQARERTQVLMDIANQVGGFVIGTGDLSELALGWATYNGDHMSMYGVNASVAKTLIRHIVKYVSDTAREEGLSEILQSILDTPISPELLPPENGDISQVTENIVGPYDLHDFILYYIVRYGFSPAKILHIATHAFNGVFDKDTIKYWLKIFIKRFFAQQFKRSCLPDGPMIGTVSLSPRGSWSMPSDAIAAEWLAELE